ncbi:MULTISPECIES: DNA/RNA non-specific endonuclease [Bizionia]|uniref:Endonuclease n=1 Tax=Bizionia algoritergicola TaxID=291187 RepID=A0A5D0QXF5_9FLAO|nr:MULTISPECIES: DNA/RNA non-specific endonuclease [Bizionia]OBX22659.1 endonuclease [Bizionia sp. APA-3]TYB72914.1 DNA/RNA non-specific endonuclease [Bizionia algoritergicola]
MTKRTVYSILAIVLVFGVYGYEFFLNKKEEQAIVDSGREIKTPTVAFFLPSSTTGQVVHHEGYSLSYSEPHEQAEWVAYELKKEHLSQTNFERPYFEVDKAVKTGAASWRNYKNSGYDRGHLCPAADRRYSKEAHDETFLTSNISPQNHAFNSGIWNSLEQKTRYWASKYHGVYVVTGGVLGSDLKTIGSEKVAVPKQFYKIILDYNEGDPKVLAFLMPHVNSKQPLYNFVVSVDAVEELTGIDFFPELDDAVEARIESSSDYKKWRF